MLPLLAILWFSFVAILVVAIVPSESRRLVRQRISEVAVAKRPPVTLRLLNRVASLNQFLAIGWYIRGLGRALEKAGIRLAANQFLSIQEILAVLVMGIASFLMTRGGQKFDLGMFLLAGFLGFIAPLLWLRQRIHLRRMTVSRDLPEVVDLLALCVSAGTDLMGAMNRVVREFRPCPLRDELSMFLQEVRVGRRRRDALREMAIRLDTPEALAFTRTLIQVDRMGTGLNQAMPVLSEDMRMQRYNWAERYAQQAPMKMLIPLVLSLAAAMVIVAAPILVKFFRGGLMDPAKTMMTRQ